MLVLACSLAWEELGLELCTGSCSSGLWRELRSARGAAGAWNRAWGTGMALFQNRPCHCLMPCSKPRLWHAPGPVLLCLSLESRILSASRSETRGVLFSFCDTGCLIKQVHGVSMFDIECRIAPHNNVIFKKL